MLYIIGEILSQAPKKNKISRKDFFTVATTVLGTIAILPFIKPDVDPFRDNQGENLRVFKDLEEARTFLEAQGGSKWIQGDAVKQLESMPWQNSQAWTSFRDLKTIGDNSHFVYLIPKSDGTSFSVLGLEPGQGGAVIDFVDGAGKPQAIKVNTPISLKSLIKKDYETLATLPVFVGPDLLEKQGSPNYIKMPEPGMYEGFVHSTDGTRYHYFQGSVK